MVDHQAVRTIVELGNAQPQQSSQIAIQLQLGGVAEGAGRGQISESFVVRGIESRIPEAGTPFIRSSVRI
ncbi:hypothetical protein [Pseudonocardia adelaidensis]